MKIGEAVKQALDEGKCITRDAYLDIVKMWPISKGTPLTIMMADGSLPCKNWNPTAEDLMAEDWILVNWRF